MVITRTLRREVYRALGREWDGEGEGYDVAEVGLAVPRSRDEFADALEGAAESAYVGSGECALP